MHMQQLRDDWYSVNASNPGSIRVFHSTADGNCFFYTLSQHLTGSEDHKLLLRLHTVIELLLNIEFYMNFTNGCISVFGGYVNVHSTANGAYRHSDHIASTVTWLRLPWAAVRGLCSFAFRALLVSSCSVVCPLCWLPRRLVYVGHVRILDLHFH
jgi:hypothetical protein